MTIELRAPGARALFEPSYGGRLHQLFVEVEGHEEPLLLSPEDTAAYALDPTLDGCYPMAPWPNRIRDSSFAWRGHEVRVDNGRQHALHGLVLDPPWDVVARVGRVLEMTCPLGPVWPWDGSCWQRFELGPDYLAMKMEVRSARAPFPAGCCWHPWFRRRLSGVEDVALTVPARLRYEFEGHLPTGALVPPEGEKSLNGSAIGTRTLDDCYTALEPAAVTVRWPRLELTVSIGAAAPHVQVFATEEALCVEPQTCAPDAFNLAAKGVANAGSGIAEPGRPISLQSRWSWKVVS